MNKIIKRVTLISNPVKDEGLEYFATVRDYLISCGFIVKVAQGERDASSQLIYVSEEELYHDTDAAVICGGDGTLLAHAEGAIENGVPVIGINIGRLGYMAGLERDEYYRLSRLLTGEYGLDERMTLTVKKRVGDKTEVIMPYVLNEVVIRGGNMSKLSALSLVSNGAYVTRYRCDGLIAATPTGSTAYSMSAGGPVLDPELSCICVTPICASSPVARPMVFSGGSELVFYRDDDREEYHHVIGDGNIVASLYDGEEIVIGRSNKNLKLITLKNHKFFKVLKEKITGLE